MAATPSMVIRIAASMDELKKNMQEGRNQIETTTAAMSKIAASLQGDKLIQQAHNVAAAVHQIGGASKLTGAEQERVHAFVTKALDKYQALGRDAPAALKHLADATKQVEPPTSSLTARMVALGAFIGTMAANAAAALGRLAWQGVQAVVRGVADLVARSAEISGVTTAFATLTRTIGETADRMLGAMRTASRGLVSDFDLMSAANKAMLLGLPLNASSMGTLAQTAVILGRAMRLDATKSIDDLITALGRSSPMILDNLGLTVKVGEANEQYAQQLGKAVDELTDAEKKTAFYTAAMAAARDKVAAMGDVQLTFGDRLRIVKIGLQNFTDGLATAIAHSPVLNAAIGAIGEVFTEAFGANQTQLVQTLITWIDRIVMAVVDGAMFVVEFGKTVATVFSASQLQAHALATALLWVGEQVAGVVATILELAASVPGVGGAFDGAADSARRAADFFAGVRAESAKATAAAWDGVRGQSAAHQTLDKVGTALFNFKVKLAEASLAQVSSAAIATTLAGRHGAVSATTGTLTKEQKKFRDSVVPVVQQLGLYGDKLLALRMPLLEITATTRALTDRSRELEPIADELVAQYADLIHITPPLIATNQQLALVFDTVQHKMVLVGDAAEEVQAKGMTLGDFLKTKLGPTILAAFTGGGDVGKSLGGAIGGFVTSGESTIGKAAGAMARKIGGTIGSVVGSVIPVVGTLLGGLAGSFIGKLFSGSEEKKVNPIRQAFIDQAGGLEQLGQKLTEAAGAQGDFLVKQLLAAKTTKNYEAAIAAINTAFDAHKTKLQETAAAEAARWTATQAGVEAVNARVAAGITTQESFTIAAGAAVALFGEWVTKTGNVWEAMQKLSPTLDVLQQQQQALGLTGSAAIDKLLGLRDVTKANEDVLKAAGANVQVMQALGATGLLNQEIFTAWGRDTAHQINALIGRGATMDQTLALMQPTLQGLWEAQQKYGFEVDATTKALIDQGLEAGVIGESQKSINAQLLEVLGQIRDVLKDAAGQAAGIPEALRRVPTRLPNPFEDWQLPDIPQDFVPGEAYAAKHGGAGTVTRPTWFLAGERGPEEFAFSGAGRRFAGGGGIGGGVIVQQPIRIEVDGRVLAEVIERIQVNDLKDQARLG